MRFNPHTYMRCDIFIHFEASVHPSFNPHTYMRCDLLRFPPTQTSISFQSTHLHEVWLGIVLCSKGLGAFQSTHLHEVWHRYGAQKFNTFQVSIHTPTWGVTGRWNIDIRKRRFQSTHLHEVWQRVLNKRFLPNRFNPHTYMRCDLLVITWLLSRCLFQSTHLHEVWPQATAVSKQRT